MRRLLFALTLWVPLQASQASTVQRGFELLEQDSVDDAERVFRQVLEQQPQQAAALEGLVWALLKKGDVQAAAKISDLRAALKPREPWRRQHLVVLELVPDRRQEALDGYVELLREQPDDVELRLAYARLLSFTEGRLSEAVTQYTKVVSMAPNHGGARLGLAQSLAWHGESKRAELLYDAVLQQDSENVQALLGRAQVARWTGRPTLARRLLQHALSLRPDDPQIQAELAYAELYLGNRTAARNAAQAVLGKHPSQATALEVMQHIKQQTAPLVELFGLSYHEAPTRLHRYEIGLRGEAHLMPSTRLRVLALGTRFLQEFALLERVRAEIELSQSLGQGITLSGHYGGQHTLGVGDYIHTGGGTISTKLPFPMTVGGRRRLLVDDPLDESIIAPVERNGSGGMPVHEIALNRLVHEGFIRGAFSPFSGSYIYANVVAGMISDGNFRTTVAAGLGVNPLASAGFNLPVEFTLKYNYFLLSHSVEQAGYFSPLNFQVHNPGAELRYNVGEWAVLGMDGGPSLRAGAPLGWIAAAYGRLSLDWFQLEARAQRLDDTYFKTFAATLRVMGRF